MHAVKTFNRDSDSESQRILRNVSDAERLDLNVVNFVRINLLTKEILHDRLDDNIDYYDHKVFGFVFFFSSVVRLDDETMTMKKIGRKNLLSFI